jgi:flagellar hook assembly protein FlgD
VYNLKGQLVNTLLSQTELSAGAHSLVWYGCDTKGKTLSSGVYFYRLTYGGKILTRKMVLAK